MIRVLIAEDSITQREILRRLIEDDPDFKVVAEARNGREAVDMTIEQRPDVVLMDIHMPNLDGIAATREIMDRCPTPIIIASATLRKRDIDHAMYAFQAGAISVIEKPEGAVLLNLAKIGPTLRAELAAAAKANVSRRAPEAAPPTVAKASVTSKSLSVLGLCASTGGPPVLLEILSAIPRPYPLPILLVQHISRGFEEGFARWLSDSSGQNVCMARNGQRLEAGIWMAPSNHHLLVGSPSRIELLEGKAGEIHCPSGNPMFASLARHLGPKAAGVLLTGMGDDGASGLLSLKTAGGMTIIQDRASSLIWGMPKAGQALGAATHEMNPRQIAQTLTQAATGDV